jgi:hypothetical protein
MKLASIVEGHGEVAAVPLLLRRVIAAVAPGVFVDLVPPFRVPRNRIVRPGELERAVELQARKAGPGGAVLILLDADDDCPADLAPRLHARATAARGDRRLGVVLANREFEAWFLASVEALRSLLVEKPETIADPERPRSPKAWLERNLAGGYQPTLDQPRLVAALDLERARRAPSFDKLLREVTRITTDPM